MMSSKSKFGLPWDSTGVTTIYQPILVEPGVFLGIARVFEASDFEMEGWEPLLEQPPLKNAKWNLRTQTFINTVMRGATAQCAPRPTPKACRRIDFSRLSTPCTAKAAMKVNLTEDFPYLGLNKFFMLPHC